MSSGDSSLHVGVFWQSLASQVPKRWQSLGAILPPRPVTGYGTSAGDCHLFGHLKILATDEDVKWAVGFLLQTIGIDFSTPGYNFLGRGTSRITAQSSWLRVETQSDFWRRENSIKNWILTIKQKRAPPLTLILLTWRIWWAPNNAGKWHMGFNSALKGLTFMHHTSYI